jgi:hypothetical protein
VPALHCLAAWWLSRPRDGQPLSLSQRELLPSGQPVVAVTDAVGHLEAFIRERKSDLSPGLLVFRLEFAQPSLNVRKEVRIIAMWAGQRGNRSRQGSEALCIQIDSGRLRTPSLGS